MSAQLLELFRRHRGLWLGCEAIQTALGTSPTDVHRHVQQFRQMGHNIEHSPVYGFRLLSGSGTFNTEQIGFGLETTRIGRRVLVYESTCSTNDVAWQYAQEPGYDGLAVFAHYQERGRGRLGRQWLSQPGLSLLCSVLLQRETTLSGAALSLVAGVATAQAIEACQGLTVRIKWPNDVMAQDQKLAGTMVEARQRRTMTDYVIGIGINCHQRQDDFDETVRDSAVSLAQLSGSDVDRVVLGQGLLSVLEDWVIKAKEGKTEELHRAWLSRCDQLGQRLSLTRDGQNYTGRVIDVHPEKGLILQQDDGVIRLFDVATTRSQPD